LNYVEVKNTWFVFRKKVGFTQNLTPEANCEENGVIN
jgi:hypothetical protein